MVDDGRDGPGGTVTGEFTQQLQDLKESGSAVLVTGSGTVEAHRETCRRMMGETSAAPRHRLLVFTDGTFAVDDRLSGADDGETHVLTASATRSTTAVAQQDTGTTATDLAGASPGELGDAIVETVEAIERRDGPLEPTQLRLGVDSLSPLLDAHGERAVFGFLLVATAYVRHLDALGHVHLPVGREAYVARLLAPLFDAVVEARVRDGQPQQRWHLVDGDVTSRWLSL